MVLEFGGDDNVARPDRGAEPVVTQRIRHQIERLGGVLGEDQLVRGSTDERRDTGPAQFERVGGLLHQLVRAAVHGAVGGGQEASFGVEHLHGLLRRRAGVQVGQPLAAPHHPVEDREVRPHPVKVGDVEFG